jgi:hypothetical protein
MRGRMVGMARLLLVSQGVALVSWGAVFIALCFLGYHASDNDPLQFTAAAALVICGVIAVVLSIIHMLLLAITKFKCRHR